MKTYQKKMKKDRNGQDQLVHAGIGALWIEFKESEDRHGDVCGRASGPCRRREHREEHHCDDTHDRWLNSLHLGKERSKGRKKSCEKAQRRAGLCLPRAHGTQRLDASAFGISSTPSTVV